MDDRLDASPLIIVTITPTEFHQISLSDTSNQPLERPFRKRPMTMKDCTETALGTAAVRQVLDRCLSFNRFGLHIARHHVCGRRG